MENRGRKENKKASAVITGRFSRVNPQIRTWVSSRFPADLRALIMGSIGRAGRALKAKPCRKGGKERKEERKKGRKEERKKGEGERERLRKERQKGMQQKRRVPVSSFLSLSRSFRLCPPSSTPVRPLLLLLLLLLHTWTHRHNHTGFSFIAPNSINCLLIKR